MLVIILITDIIILMNKEIIITDIIIFDE